MKILVLIKRVVDHNVRVHIKPDESGVDTDGVKMSVNPFDLHAVEEAVRMKEAGIASEVIAVSVGIEKCKEQLHTAMAMGIDRSVIVKCDEDLSPLDTAKLLSEVVIKEKPDIVLAGHQSIDGGNCQTPQMLAALLGWSQGIAATKLEKPSNGKIKVTRRVSDGHETLDLRMPTVISATVQLNKPRRASLGDVLKAKKKPLEVLSIPRNSSTGNQLSVIKTSEPPKRHRGITVSNTDELISKLREETGVFS